MTNHPNRRREYLCAFGNCQERFNKIKVSTNYYGYRQAFCCAEHGAAWLLRQDHMHDKDTPHARIINQICNLRPA